MPRRLAYGASVRICGPFSLGTPRRAERPLRFHPPQQTRRRRAVPAFGRVRAETGGERRGKRLFRGATGLLLFTNDGYFSHRIAVSGPSTGSGTVITKTYLATLKTAVSQDQQISYITRVALGLILPPEKKASEQKAAPAELSFIDETTCRITVTEGQFHEVRRIFKALGNEVLALKRIAIGNLELPQDLAPGEYKSFLPEQILF